MSNQFALLTPSAAAPVTHINTAWRNSSSVHDALAPLVCIDGDAMAALIGVRKASALNRPCWRGNRG